MANRKDIEAGKAHVLLGVDISPLIKGLSAVQGKMNSWGKSIMTAGAGVFGLGASITGALSGAVGIFANVGSELADISGRTGVAASTLAELGYAAEQSGSSLDTVGKALINMQKKGLDPKQFDQVAAAIAAIPDEVERTQAAMEIFGKSGAELLPMLGDLAKLRQESRDLGIIPSEEAVADAALIGDKFDQIKSQIIAGIFEIGAALAPMIIPILEAITNIGTSVIKWVRENAALVRTIAMIGAGLMAAGAIIMTIGGMFVAVGAVIGGIATVLATIGPILAAVFSPIGLIVAAVVAIGVGIALAVRYWLLFTESGKAAMAWIRGVIAKIWEGIKGIGDALMAGNITLAAQIAATGMKAAFFSAIDLILDKIMWIPKRILEAMEPIAELDPFGKLPGLLKAAQTSLKMVGNAPGKWAADAMAEHEKLKLQAAQEREAKMKAKVAPPGRSGPQEGTPEWYAMQNAGAMASLKANGSFNASALTMQNFGHGKPKDDQAKKGNGFLEELTKKLMPDLIKKTENNSLAYGA